MKHKFLSVLIALVLALSLCLVTAVPAAAADPVGLNLISVGVDSTAEWVDAETIEPCAGAYSLKLYVLKGKDEGGGGSAVYIPVNVAIEDIDSLSFSRLGTTDLKDAKINLLIDADNDGDLDFTEIEALTYHLFGGAPPLDFFGEDAMLFLNPKNLIETDTWATVDAYSTYYCWGTDKTGNVYTISDPGGQTCGLSLGVANGYQVESAGSIDPTDKVLGVIVLLGCGSGVADQTVYIDNIEVDGDIYDLEPTTATDGTTSVGDVPGVTSITPNFGDIDTAALPVTITGLGLTGASAVTLSGTGVIATNVQVVSDTQITADLAIADSAAAGLRDVIVTIPGDPAPINLTGTELFEVLESFTLTAPSSIDLGLMIPDAVATGESDTAGTVVTNVANWQVDAADVKALNTGFMVTAGADKLAAPFQIGAVDGTYADAATGITYGAVKVLPFFVSQAVATDDPVGSYTITITFVATY